MALPCCLRSLELADSVEPRIPNRPPTPRPYHADDPVTNRRRPPATPRPVVRDRINLVARSLELTDAEHQFLPTLVSLLPTPRSIKKLANLYRLLRISVHHELDEFIGTDEAWLLPSRFNPPRHNDRRPWTSQDAAHRSTRVPRERRNHRGHAPSWRMHRRQLGWPEQPSDKGNRCVPEMGASNRPVRVRDLRTIRTEHRPLHSNHRPSI
jgi:hypothetical protein